MPLRVGKENQNMAGPMETALAQGLQQQYRVYSGDEVAIKAKEIAKSRVSKKDCDETKCFEDIAMAFNSEYIASASVTQIEGGYLLSLNIRSIADNKAVFSNSLPCKGCDAFQVIDKLKELSGAPVPVAVVPAAEEPQMKINPNDPESALWGEVQKGNTADDYAAYLAQYPKGKYVALAKSRSKKLQEQATSELAQQDQSAWESAGCTATEESYQGYLQTYPQGRYITLAQARIAKLKKEAAQAAAQAPKPGKVFKDCADCPDMVVIPGGSFTMGFNQGGDESPAHTVTIRQAFAMGKTEVTQGQWKAIMGSNPSNFANCGDTCPVERVNWNDAQEFIQKLNAKTGKQYRLPSEAEWEYACRAGGQSEYCGGDNIDSVAWYTSNSGNTTHPGAQKQANAFGLYDMSGNVWEWTADSYHANYNGAPNDGSEWQGDGARRVLRGGSWGGDPSGTRSAYRGSGTPGLRGSSIGFRVGRTLP